MQIKQVAAFASLLLAGCQQPSQQEKAAANSGEPVLAATAADGTKLWVFRPKGTSRYVYFASSGTQTSHRENCGKSCTREVVDSVPTAQPYTVPKASGERP